MNVRDVVWGWHRDPGCQEPGPTDLDVGPAAPPSPRKREALPCLMNRDILEALEYANVGEKGHPVVYKGDGKTIYQPWFRSRNIIHFTRRLKDWWAIR